MKLRSRRIFLTQGKSTLVDHDDYARLTRHRWHAHKARSCWYARTNTLGGMKYLHRLLMGEPPGLVDHINRDSLDNRRGNLRAATRGQNSANSVHPLGRSGYRGVWVCGAKFRAHICVLLSALPLAS